MRAFQVCEANSAAYVSSNGGVYTTEREVMDTIESVNGLDFECMDLRDRVKFLDAMCQFAEQIKPIIVKYSNKMTEESTFLLKM